MKMNQMKTIMRWASLMAASLTLGAACTTTDHCPRREHYFGKMLLKAPGPIVPNGWRL